MLNRHVQKVLTAAFQDMTEQVKSHRSSTPSILLSLRMLYEYNISMYYTMQNFPPFTAVNMKNKSTSVKY